MTKFTPADNVKIGMLMLIWGTMTDDPSTTFLSFWGVIDGLWFLASFSIFATGIWHWDTEPSIRSRIRSKDADRDAVHGSGR